jgi:hypothetical protein
MQGWTFTTPRALRVALPVDKTGLALGIPRHIKLPCNSVCPVDGDLDPTFSLSGALPIRLSLADVVSGTVLSRIRRYLCTSAICIKVPWSSLTG